jgi:hypothetical protein
MRFPKIWYSPYSLKLDHPSDRRRFSYWARKRGVEVSTTPTLDYDILYATVRTPIKTMLYARKQRKTVYFELVDGYLEADRALPDFIRLCVKRENLSKSIQALRFSEIVRMKCEIADLIIVPCKEILDQTSEINIPKQVILDFHDEIPFVKAKLETNKGVSLFWEGQSFTLPGLKGLHPAFSELKNRQVNFKLSIVTDDYSPKLNGKYLNVKTINHIRELKALLREDLNLYSWNLTNLEQASKKVSLGILPVDSDRYLAKFKPENRLLIMWRLGLPCITSPLDSYNRVFAKIGMDGTCANIDEWKRKIIEYHDNPEIAQVNIMKGQQYVQDYHSEFKLLKKWDEIFAK